MIRFSVVIGAFVAAGCLAVAAAAQTAPPPPGTSGIDQYVETVPTSAGGRAAGLAKGKSRPLPATTRSKISRQGGTDSVALQKIATLSSYGAPATIPSRRTIDTTRDPHKAGGHRSAVSAAVSAASGGGGVGPLLLLGILFVVITAVVVAVAGRRTTR